MRCLCPSSWWGMNWDRSTHLPAGPSHHSHSPFAGGGLAPGTLFALFTHTLPSSWSLSSQALHCGGKGPGLSLFPIDHCTPLPSMGTHSSQLSCRSPRDQAERYWSLLWPRRVVATVSDLEAVRGAPLLLWGVSPSNSLGNRRRGFREIRPLGK